MNDRTFHWTTTDGLRLEAYEWPIEQAVAVVCLVHGLGEHVRRYDSVAAFFNRHDIAVIGNDRRGHGQSEGKRGHAPGLDPLLDEIEHLRAEAAERYPGVPQVLYGQSMGGNLVLNYTLRRSADVAGVIAMSPWIQLGFQPNPLLIALGKAMRRIYPAFTQSNNLDISNLSTDPAVARAYEADPLTHDRISSAMGVAMLDAADHLHQYSGKFPAPLLLMNGTGDRLVSPDAIREFADRASGNITYIPWEGLYHELHNEYRREEVLNTTILWLQKQGIIKNQSHA